MENKAKNTNRRKYTIDELVRIGDHIHDSSCSFIMCINDLDESDNKKNILFSTHGKEEDLVMMFFEVLKKNPKMELIMLKSMAIYNAMKMEGQNND